MTGPRGFLATVPLRVQLVAGFTTAMLVVLTSAGAFVYSRVEFALDRQLNAQLVDATARLAPLIAPDGQLTDEPPLLSGETYQVLSADGKVIDREPGSSSAALIDPSLVREALQHPVQKDIGELLPSSSRPLRVYAQALSGSGTGPTSVLVVAAERNHRDEALRELLAQLGLAGLATLLVTAVVGDRLAKASLRPVERYRRQANDIAAGATGVRLDVPPGRDDEITRLGHTLNMMLTTLEESLEHERRFVNDASHELRTPITLIGTRVQLALRRPRTAQQHEDVLTEIEADIDRLSLLADQLLTLGTARPTTDVDGVDLAALARSEVERRRTLAPAGSAYRQTGSLRAVTTGPITVALARLQLEQLLGNLLDNSAVHGRPPVTVTVDRSEGFARLMVSDAGDGMDAVTLATAPDRFARAPEARTRPGSGLGLSLVQAIVIAAGGELRLCVHGRHERFGISSSVSCEHRDEMTVTVLLPLVEARPQQPAGDSASAPEGDCV